MNINGTTTTRLNCLTAGQYEIAVTAYQTAAGDEPAKMQLHLGGQPLPKAQFAVTAEREAPQTYRSTFTIAGRRPVDTAEAQTPSRRQRQ